MGENGVDGGNRGGVFDTVPDAGGPVHTFEFVTDRVVRGCLALYLLGVVAMALGELLPALVRVPLVVVPLTVVPGALVVLLLTADPVVDATRVLYAVGTSLLVLMFAGVVTNVALPLAGFDHPLSKLPLAATITLVVGGLAFAARRRRGGGTVLVRVPPPLHPVPLGFVALPLVAIVSVMVLNTTGVNVPLLVVLAVVAVLPLLAVRRIGPEWYAFGVWSIALSILYHKSLWQYSGFGGRPHGIQAWKAGRWSPGVVELSPYTSELLPTGLLFPMYARLSDVFILTQYEVVNPLFVSFIPVAVFVAARRLVDADAAFLAAATFAFAHPFYLQYPTAGRAASPVIFLSLFSVALVDDDHSPVVTSLFAILFLFGIVVSHYGTSYYVMFSLFLAIGLLFGLRLIDRNLPFPADALPDGGGFLRGGARSVSDDRLSTLSPSLVLYYATATLAWFLYMRGGWKFELLPKHVAENFQQLVQGAAGSGRTAARLQKSYGATSIRISKYVYLTIGVLMAVGFAVVLYRRVVERDRTVDDQYFVVASSVFAIFGATLAFRNWGGGRPMMITFVFSTVFAVIGIVWLAGQIPGPRLLDGRPSYGGREAFAVLLAALFVLNSGVAAGTVFSGFAPSNVPVQEQLAASDDPTSQVTVHRHTDIATHVWMVEHGGGADAYGDTFGARQFDWYRPAVAAEISGVNGSYDQENKPKVFDPNAGRIEAGYVLVMGHNEALGMVWPTRFGPAVPLEDLRLSERNRVYTNGESSVYYATSPTNTTNSSAG